MMNTITQRGKLRTWLWSCSIVVVLLVLALLRTAESFLFLPSPYFRHDPLRMPTSTTSHQYVPTTRSKMRRFYSNNSNSNDVRPLHEILEELVERGISFSPTASRIELESLLNNGGGTQQQQQQQQQPQQQQESNNPIQNDSGNVIDDIDASKKTKPATAEASTAEHTKSPSQRKLDDVSSSSSTPSTESSPSSSSSSSSSSASYYYSTQPPKSRRPRSQRQNDDVRQQRRQQRRRPKNESTRITDPYYKKEDVTVSKADGYYQDNDADTTFTNTDSFYYYDETRNARPRNREGRRPTRRRQRVTNAAAAAVDKDDELDDRSTDSYYYYRNRHGSSSRNDDDEYDDNHIDPSRRDVRRRQRNRQRRRDRHAPDSNNNDNILDPNSILDQIYQTSKHATEIVSEAVPEKMVKLGNKATNIATKKTQKFWNEFVESTFDENGDDELWDDPTGFTARRRRRRRRRPQRPRSDDFDDKDDDDTTYYYSRQQRRRRQQPPRSEGSSSQRQQRRQEDQQQEEQRQRPQQPPNFTTSSRSPPPPPTARSSTEKVDDTINEGKRKTIPIRVIIAELHTLGIGFPPTASRQELEDLLSKAKQTTSVPPVKAQKRVDDEWVTSSEEATKTWSDLLSSLVEEEDNIAIDDDNDDDDDDDTVPFSDVGSKIYEQGRKATSKAVEKGNEVFQSVKKKATTTTPPASWKSSTKKRNQQENDPSTLIVDAVIEDFSRDETIREIEAELISPEEWEARSVYKRPPRKRRPQRQRPPQQPQQTQENRRRRPRPQPTASKPPTGRDSYRRQRSPGSGPDPYVASRREAAASKRNADADTLVVKSSLFAATTTGFPAAGTSDETHQSTASTNGGKRPQRKPRDKKRKIYSPYGRPAGAQSSRRKNDDDDDEFDYYKDGLNEFGDMFSNTVESFIWGEEGSAPKRKRATNSSSTRSSDRARNPEVSQFSGHWKDRMEEQFDRFMGVHEDGHYYKRWAEEEEEYEKNAGGTDAVSYAQGRAPKRPANRRKKKNKKLYDNPFWSDDDNFLSFLFGTGERAPSRSISDRYRNRMENGSLVRMLRSLLRSVSIFGGALARWASVRGALPQPIVVAGTVAAGITSLPGRKLWNMGFTIVLMRVMGELLQGYLHEDDPLWGDPRREDYYYDEDENDDDDDDDSKPPSSSRNTKLDE